MVVQLLKYGSDPSLIDGEGCSCVHLAAQFGHTSIVAYLIAKGQVRRNCKLAANPYFLCICVDLRGLIGVSNIVKILLSLLGALWSYYHIS